MKKTLILLIVAVLFVVSVPFLVFAAGGTSTTFQSGNAVKAANFTGTVNVRTAPGTYSPVVGQHVAGDTGTISNVTGQGQWVAEYSAPGGGYYWWNVTFNSGASGWMVENYLIIDPNPPVPVGNTQPSVVLSANSTSVNPGDSIYFTWSSNNTVSCTASGGWSGALSTSGSKSIIATNASVYPTQTAFIITCLGSNGTNVSQTVRVDISASNLSNLLPTVTLTSSPSSIISGQTSLLSWSTTNAVTCNATGAWTGVMPTSGSVVVSPTQTSSYTIDCNNSLGAIATDSKTVTVSQNTGGGTPTVSLSVSTSAITLGQSATLSWTTSNVTNCTASGGWSGAQTTSGTQVITPNQTTSYSLSCYSTVTGSSASQNVTVNVTQPIGAPSVTLSASQTSVANGQPVTLSWVSTNASSCAAPWTSSVAPSGSQIIYPTFPSSYTIYCTGANNTTVSSNSVAITVGQGSQTPAVSTKFNPGDNVVTANFTGTVNIRDRKSVV